MATPKTIRFRGAVYRLAAEPDPFEERVKDLQKKDKGEQDPFDVDEDAPVGKEPVEELKMEPADFVVKTNALIDEATEEAAKLLDKHGVSAVQAEPVVSLDSDGVELTFYVGQDALAKGSFNNPAVIFDYAIKGGDSEADSFWEGLKDKVDKGIGFVFKGYTMTQAIFDFCNHYFGAEPGTRHFNELLEAVGFLQKDVDEVRAESRLEIPKDSADEEEIRDWVKSVLVEIWENRVDRNSKKEVEDWYNKTQVSQMIMALRKHKYINAAQEGKLLKFLGDSGLDYDEFMKEVENEVKGTAQKAIPLKTRVERQVRDLTKHENYSGEIKYGIDDKTGHIIAGINAPYKMLYVFEKQPGGKLDFLEAAMNICNQTMVVKDRGAAADLLSANLTLAEAYEAAVNVEDRRNRKTRKEFSVDLLEELLSEQKSKKDKGKGKEPAQEGGEVPAEDRPEDSPF